MCSERSLSFKRCFGLRSQVGEDEESVPDLESVSGQSSGMVFVFGVSSEESDVVDLVFVAFLCLNFLEA